MRITRIIAGLVAALALAACSASPTEPSQRPARHLVADEAPPPPPPPPTQAAGGNLFGSGT
jgi:hypothetical protein